MCWQPPHIVTSPALPRPHCAAPLTLSPPRWVSTADTLSRYCVDILCRYCVDIVYKRCALGGCRHPTAAHLIQPLVPWAARPARRTPPALHHCTGHSQEETRKNICEYGEMNGRLEESAIGNDAMYEEDNDEEEDTVDIGRQSHK